MSDDDLGDIQEIAATDLPDAAAGPAPKPPRIPALAGSQYTKWQPDRFQGNPVARAINWCCDRIAKKRYNVEAQEHQVGESWTAAVFYAIGAEPTTVTGPMHPGINVAKHTGQYVIACRDATTEAPAAETGDQEFREVDPDAVEF